MKEVNDEMKEVKGEMKGDMKGMEVDVSSLTVWQTELELRDMAFAEKLPKKTKGLRCPHRLRSTPLDAILSPSFYQLPARRRNPGLEKIDQHYKS